MSQLVNRARVAAGVALLLSVPTAAEATQFAQWYTPYGSAGNWGIDGTLGSTSLVMENNYTDPLTPGVGTFTADLSNSSVYAQAGSSTQQAVRFETGYLDGSTWVEGVTTITFDSAVSNLGLYMKFWRRATYQLSAFDASGNAVSYSFLSGDFATPPAIVMDSFTPDNFWTNGIIAFSGDVKSISLSKVPGPDVGGNGVLTLAILDPVPAPSAIALLGLAGLAGRRRR